MSYALVLILAWVALASGGVLAVLAAFAGQLTLVGYIDNPALQYLAGPQHAFAMRTSSLAVIFLSLGLFVWAHFLASRRWVFWTTSDKAEDASLAQALSRGDWGFIGGRMKVALLRHPGDPASIANLGLALWGLGRWDDAKLAFEKAVELGARGRIQECLDGVDSRSSPSSLVSRPRLPLISAGLAIPVLLLSAGLGHLGGYLFRENALTHYDDSEFDVMFTEHFRILFHDRVFATGLSEEVEGIAKTVMEDLGIKADEMPAGYNQIFVCADEDEYRQRNRGAVSAWAGGHAIWQTRTTFVYPSENLERDTLPHELTHIILGQFTGHSESWLHEGIATYTGLLYAFDHDHDRMPLGLDQFKVFDHLKGGQHFHVEDLLNTEPSALENTDRVDVFYIEAFSIIYFLREKYGPDKFHNFIRLLKGNRPAKAALTEAYKEDFKNFDDLEGSWLVYYTL